MRLAIEVEDRGRGIETEAGSSDLVCRAPDRNVASQVQTALQQHRMCVGFAKYLLELFLEPLMRFHIAFGDVQNDALAVISNTMLWPRQILARQPEIH